MKKLKLDLDALAVDSLEAAPEGDDARGTVQGAMAAEPSVYCGTTSFHYYLGGSWMQN